MSPVFRRVIACQVLLLLSACSDMYLIGLENGRGGAEEEAQVIAVEEQVGEFEVDPNDPHFESLVYISSSGLKFYQFVEEPQDIVQAYYECEDRGLRLMTRLEATSLEEEFLADESKLNHWLNGQAQISTWTSHVGAWGDVPSRFFSRVHGDVHVSPGERNGEANVRCVNDSQVEVVEPSSDFLVYTDNSQLKYYQFDWVERDYNGAAEHCEEKGLRLMSEEEADSLEKELEANSSQRSQWLKGQNSRSTWIGVPSAGVLSVYSFDVSEKVYRGRPPRYVEMPVRCVSR